MCLTQSSRLSSNDCVSYPVKHIVSTSYGEQQTAGNYFWPYQTRVSFHCVLSCLMSSDSNRHSLGNVSTLLDQVENQDH